MRRCIAVAAAAPSCPAHPAPAAARPPPRPSARGISNTAGTLAGVVGVAATGYMLQWAGGADHAAGWYQAFAAAAAQCLAGSLVFAAAARGDRLFGGDATSEYS